MHQHSCWRFLGALTWIWIAATLLGGPCQPAAAGEPPVAMNTLESLERAIADLGASFKDRYPKAAEYRRRLDELRQAGALANDPRVEDLRREALLANPLLDFDRLLVIRRGDPSKPGGIKLGLPQNWQVNTSIPKTGYDNDLAVLSPVRPGGSLTRLFAPNKDAFIGDLKLHWHGDRLLFSSPMGGAWQVWEIRTDGTGLRQVTTGEQDNFDGCYLPDGGIAFVSTACMQGVPCVGGADAVGNLYRIDTDGTRQRRLCFDQDQNWSPTMLHDGRVLFTRWEYSDTAHYFTRLLMHMNPDGTGQFAHYGSNSYWPTSLFYAKPIPDHPSQLVAIVSGHHGVCRMGELVILDPAQGQFEADGVIQRIPGYGRKVHPTIADQLVNGSWPKFLHPWPLSGKYFLVASQTDANSLWGIYLVDIFDNRILLAEEPGRALLEPVPLRKTAMPPVIPDRTDASRSDAVIYLQDVYAGPGMAGVPRGTVKRLRLLTPHFAYDGMGGHRSIGIDGPWDVRIIHGTVNVHPDGSALFKVPANTPIAVQPLDERGRALQVMRSWYTAMPGESVSCIGCHEPQNTVPLVRSTLAMRGAPEPITPWNGPARGFSFVREVQPVLDRRCVGCHDGSPAAAKIPNFKSEPRSGFTPGYIALHPFVRRPGPESDYHIQVPLEWHTSTSELIQLLEKGHHQVKLSDEEWDRLVTWIDLNVPDHGSWSEQSGSKKKLGEERCRLNKIYTNLRDDPEPDPVTLKRTTIPFVKPDPEPSSAAVEITVENWPFSATEAKRRQAAAGLPTTSTIELAAGLTLELTLIPAGTFVMGDPAGAADERPVSAVRIGRPFYMGTCEISNAQFAQYQADHDSGYISYFGKDQNSRGHAVNQPTQPVVRVSWEQAMGFCRWLSKKTGRHFSLPNEAQWEYACRAGTSTPMNYGALDTDFGKMANMAEKSLRGSMRAGWIPAVAGSDGAAVTAPIQGYPDNAWGLRNMHGNAAEWTRTAYRPYPYREDGRDDASTEGDKVVRGGSFYDRPYRCTSGFRWRYPAWQKVFNVGFRVVCEVSP